VEELFQHRKRTMNGKHKIQRVWVDDTRVSALTEDGLQASYPFSMWKRLANATPEQRQNFYLSYTGIHWRDIDEDLSFEGMFSDAGLCERTATEDSVYYEVDYLSRVGEEDNLNKVAEEP
jgi:hypothetical protein